MSNTTVQVWTCEFLCVSDLIPEAWSGWFWTRFSQDCPFSMGNLNRGLVTADRFHAHCYEVLAGAVEDNEVSEEESEQFLSKVEKLGLFYIDLEN